MDRYYINGLVVRQDYYPIHDRSSSRTAIAQCSDGETATRICALLNADEAAPKYPNGRRMFAPDGTMLDENGNRSIFDDVDK